MPRRSLQEFSISTRLPCRLLDVDGLTSRLQRKRMLLEGLQSLSEEDTLVSFDDFARALLTDPDAQVRMRAIRLLDECDDLKLIPPFIKILKDDADAETRAEAATALGKFVELGELEEIPEQARHQVEDALLAEGQQRRSTARSPQCSGSPRLLLTP